MDFQFNAQTVKPNNPDDIPNGWIPGEHPSVIVSHEIKPSKTQGNGYMQLNIKAIDGPESGTSNIVRLNLWNSSEQAVTIARADLSALCHVTGIYMLNSLDDFRQFYNRPFNAVYRPQKEKPEYTEFKGFKPHGPFVALGAAAPAPASASTQSAFGQQRGFAPAPAPQQPAFGQPQQPQQAPAAAPAWGAPQQPQQWGAPPAQPQQQPAPQFGQQPAPQQSQPGFAPSPFGQPQQQPSAFNPGAAPGAAPAWAK